MDPQLTHYTNKQTFCCYSFFVFNSFLWKDFYLSIPKVFPKGNSQS